MLRERDYRDRDLSHLNVGQAREHSAHFVKGGVQPGVHDSHL
jgi:hypothetical protein